MAAIMLKHEDNQITDDKLRTIYSVCQKELPVYARPLFIRFMSEFIITQTMKNRKVELVEEGYDLQKVDDPIYFYDSKNKTYSPLTWTNYEGVLSSKLWNVTQYMYVDIWIDAYCSQNRYRYAKIKQCEY